MGVPCTIRLASPGDLSRRRVWSITCAWRNAVTLTPTEELGNGLGSGSVCSGRRGCRNDPGTDSIRVADRRVQRSWPEEHRRQRQTTALGRSERSCAATIDRLESLWIKRAHLKFRARSSRTFSSRHIVEHSWRSAGGSLSSSSGSRSPAKSGSSRQGDNVFWA